MKQQGGKITAELKSRYARSTQWDGKKFLNLEETNMNLNFWNMPKLLYQQLFKTKGRYPKEPLPVEEFVHREFIKPEFEPKMAWFGHSAVVLRMEGVTLAIDPMMGPDAAPIAPFRIKRFSNDTIPIIHKWPDIDAMLLTHDHFDHLDMESFMHIKPYVKKYLVAIGCARHLEAWGVDPDLILEFDWWDQTTVKGLEITFTPTRHFSGRTLNGRSSSLWGGWVIKSNFASVYFSGDGGYGDHFKTVGERLGPFDFGLMECGQYHKYWHQIHLFPEESVQAAIDAQVAKAVPVHWAGFALALHTWTDPVERFIAAAEAKGLDYSIPRLGATFLPSDTHLTPWWREFV